MSKDNILVTGGLGFIGSNFVRMFNNKYNITILDKLTYAGNKKNLEGINGVEIIIGDIGDVSVVQEILSSKKIKYLVNFAAESHVDCSIASPNNFIYTNIVGTYALLEASREYFKNTQNKDFRFVHISTDEVFGSLELNDKPFTETSRYDPSSPYSASKASSDMLVAAWHKTFGLPVIITHCSNNYGPYQHKEKFIPTVIKSAYYHQDIPIYGSGQNVRDWIFVEDHCSGIELAINKGIIGEKYLFGGNNEITNIVLARNICNIMDEIMPSKKIPSYKNLIKHVEDRKGHDFRYAVNSTKSTNNLGFSIKTEFNIGLKKTVKWFLDNKDYL